MLDGAAELVLELASQAKGQLDVALHQQLASLGEAGMLVEWGASTVLSQVETTQPFPSPDFFLEVSRAKAAPPAHVGTYVGRALWQIGLVQEDRYVGTRCIDHKRGVAFIDLVAGARVDITNEVVLTAPSSNSLCLLAARQSLFNDFLPQHLYPGELSRPADLTREIFQNALGQLAGMHGITIDSVRCVLHTVALTGRLPIAGRTSYNCRMHYPGVAFIDSVQTSAPGICEALVHECIHQALWLNNATSTTEWFPLEVETIRSPATGRQVDAAVMVHAALVYSAISQLRINAHNVSGARASAHWALSIARQLRPLVAEYPSSLNTLSRAENLADETITACA